MEDAVEAVPARRQRVTGGAELLGLGDVDLEHLGRIGQLAGRALGQRQGPAGTREHNFGPLLLGQPRHGEGQGGIGQDAGDEEPFAV